VFLDDKEVRKGASILAEGLVDALGNSVAYNLSQIVADNAEHGKEVPSDEELMDTFVVVVSYAAHDIPVLIANRLAALKDRVDTYKEIQGDRHGNYSN